MLSLLTMDRTESLFVTLNQRERKTVPLWQNKIESSSAILKTYQWTSAPCCLVSVDLWNLFLQNLEFQWGEVLLIISTWGKVVKLYRMFSEPDQKYSGSMSVCPNCNCYFIQKRIRLSLLWSSRSKVWLNAYPWLVHYLWFRTHNSISYADSDF